MYRYFLFTFIIILLDQWSKWLIVQKVDLYERITIIQNFLYITSHRNKGAAWGILQNQMIFFYIITVFVIVGIVYYMYKHVGDNKLLGVALSFMLGGAIGNFIDRLFRKEVVDFIDVMIFSYDYPIFNVADSFLVIGVGLIILGAFLDGKSKEKEKVG